MFDIFGLKAKRILFNMGRAEADLHMEAFQDYVYDHNTAAEEGVWETSMGHALLYSKLWPAKVEECWSHAAFVKGFVAQMRAKCLACVRIKVHRTPKYNPISAKTPPALLRMEVTIARSKVVEEIPTAQLLEFPVSKRLQNGRPWN